MSVGTADRTAVQINSCDDMLSVVRRCYKSGKVSTHKLAFQPYCTHRTLAQAHLAKSLASEQTQ